MMTTLQFLTFVAVAGTSPTDDLLDTVLLATQQDGVGAAPEDLLETFEGLCEAGHALACSADAWAVPFDRAAMAKRAAPLCGKSDAVACLLLGLHNAQEPWGRFSRLRAPDPVKARRILQRACNLGLERGCTEVAHTSLYGIGTYYSAIRARTSLQPLCVLGEPHACRSMAIAIERDRRGLEDTKRRVRTLLRRAGKLGDPIALSMLADRTDDVDKANALRVQACEQGAGAACGDLARRADISDEEAIPLLEAACERGDVEGCAFVALRRAAATPAHIPAAVEALKLACTKDDVRWACETADLLRLGAPPRAQMTGTLKRPGHKRRLAIDLEPGVFDCYADRVRRGNVTGEVTVAVQLAPDGTIEGAVPHAPWTDEPFVDCVFAAALEVGEANAPVEGAMQQRVTFELDHAAEVSFRARTSRDAPKDRTSAGKALRAHGKALDACLDLDSEGRANDMQIEGTVARDGTLKKATVVRSSEVAAVDNCVLEELSQPNGTRLVGALVGTVEVDFLNPAPPEEEEQDEDSKHRYESKLVVDLSDHSELTWPDGSLTWKLLVVVVRRSIVDERNAKISKKSMEVIREAHERVAQFVARHTDQHVRMTVDTLVVEGPLTTAFSKEGASGWASRMTVDPDQLPTEILHAIEPGQYHSIHLWAPIPAGFPRDRHGTAWTNDHVRGATFSSSLVPARGIVISSGRQPWNHALHELYHQLEARSSRLLGADIPSNHYMLPMTNGKLYSERTSDGIWYQAAFARVMTPDLWHDMFTWKPTTVRPKGNLAPEAEPISSANTMGRHHLNDSIREFGLFTNATTQRDDADAADGFWFGLRFDTSTRIRHVVAHLKGAAAASLEVSDGGSWRPLATEHALEGDTQTVRFDLDEDLMQLRIRVTDPSGDEEVACEEIEAYSVAPN